MIVHFVGLDEISVVALIFNLSAFSRADELNVLRMN